MKKLTLASFKENLSDILDRVIKNDVPVCVTRSSGKSAVVLSLDDFNSYKETAHLMSSNKNAARINEAIEQLESNRGMTKGLLEE